MTQNCTTKHMLHIVVFSDPDRSYTSRLLPLTQLFPLRIKYSSQPRVFVTSHQTSQMAQLKFAADTRSMFNKPAGTSLLIRPRHTSTTLCDQSVAEVWRGCGPTLGTLW